MKKSFLITLAAVSSVALIGCSSSSDDNNGGQGGGGSESTYAKPEVTVELVAKDSAYLVQNVLNTNQGDNAADLQIKVVCDAATDEANLVVDNENNKIGYLATAAASDVACTVTFDGEKNADTKTEIKFNSTTGTTEQELVNVSKKEEDAALTINGSDITFAADEKSTPHSVIFKTVKAASYTKDEGVLTKAEDQAGVKKITLTAANLDGKAKIKTSECTGEKPAGAISCEVELKSNAAVADGKITATGATDNEVVELVSNVVITEAGTPLPPTPSTPTVTIDNAKLEKHASDSKFIKIPLLVADTTINKITCQYNDGTRAAKDCTAEGELGFKAAADNTAFFVNTSKLLTLDTKSFTITVNDSKDITPLTVNKAEVEKLAKTHLVDKFTVAKTSAENTPIKEVNVEDTNGVELIIKATEENIVSYPNAEDSGKEEFNKSGQDNTVLKFHTVAKKASTDNDNKITLDNDGAADNKCSALKAKDSAGKSCKTKVKLAAENAGEKVESGITVKVGDGQPIDIFKLVKPAV